MKILITGISGLLGSELARMLSEENEVFGMTRNSSLPGYKVAHVDISDEQAVYEAVSRINPDCVIHTATMTSVDECERNPDRAYQVNALGTRNIAVACQRFDTILCHMSTDYVFAGNEKNDNGFSEFDRIDPCNVYGRSKAAGEQYVKEFLSKYFIIRTSWLFGLSRVNYISQTADALKSGKELKQADDMISAPTNVKDLSAALMNLVKTRLYGTYHLCNGGFASRYEIAARIAVFLKANKGLIKRMKVADLGFRAQRPYFSGLRNYVWQLEGFMPLRPWQDAVKEFLAEQKYI